MPGEPIVTVYRTVKFTTLNCHQQDVEVYPTDTILQLCEKAGVDPLSISGVKITDREGGPMKETSMSSPVGEATHADVTPRQGKAG